jgi:hypothetical protein
VVINYDTLAIDIVFPCSSFEMKGVGGGLNPASFIEPITSKMAFGEGCSRR